MPPKKQQQQQQQQQQPNNNNNSSANSTSSSYMGIDFGTHYSCVGVFKNDRVEICPNQQGNRTTPSVVSFVENDQLVGDEAKSQMDRNPNNTVYDVKKLIGRKVSDQSFKDEISKFPFKIVTSEPDKIAFDLKFKGKDYQTSPTDITTSILSQIRRTAETFLGETIKKAVITVPYHFNDKQKKELKDAAQSAGINVLRFVNEHSAVALAYGFDQVSPETNDVRNILIFDLGGSGLSVSMIQRSSQGLLEVLGNVTEDSLSGESFDQVLVNHFTQEFNRKHKCNLKESARSLAKLKTACEKAKRLLSNNNQASIELDSLYEGIDFFTNITRARFEDLAGTLIRDSMKPVLQLLENCKVSKEQVDRIILVGGGSRIPSIQNKLTDLFSQQKKELIKSQNQEEVVCFGATLQAHLLSQKGSSLGEKKLQNTLSTQLPIEMTTSTISIEGKGNSYISVIPQYTRLPCKRSFKIQTTEQSPKQIPLSIYQSTLSNPTQQLLSRLLFPVTSDTLEITFEFDKSSNLKVYSSDKTFQINSTN
ncbi:heat shock protein Hsp70 family protein [Tieghemostelium lacteum]|uniref:Heat shock protein Hsp70 family protein n=1 Tax=Tieghemostelium lacteum TaxID=361077 RepID=A0A151ZGV4_TIELA|nr:heat shock protein Hsp70 family protein [Tieghemostelium lacteum]|eukprot:KYQ93094.1 heat shock protein Hsp70 family protein [Tieghemostelium lacteum]